MPAFQPEISRGSQEVPGPKLGLDTHDPPLPLFGVRREECNRRGTPIATLRLVADAPDRSGVSARNRPTRRLRRQAPDAHCGPAGKTEPSAPEHIVAAGVGPTMKDQANRSEASLTEDGLYRLLVEAVRDYAIYMLDPQGMVTSWNRGAMRFKGYEPHEIIGQHFSRFYTEEDKKSGLPQRALATAEREGVFENEGWRVRKDGTRFWAHVVIDPIRSETGELMGFAKITRDLTERREAQLALEQAKEALSQAQKMEAIGHLTGGVAHDFNNLLMAILGSLELLQKRIPPDPRTTPLLENALAAGKRGATLTQRMLMFARRQPLKPEPTDLVLLIKGMRELFQRSIGSYIRIETRFPVALPLVSVDPNQLETAVLNLCINARDAMPYGGLVTISAEEAEHERTSARCVRLSVTDNGEGMDKDTLARASEPFFTTKGVGKGTGLGLAMVKGFVEQSGGRMVIKSELRQGTTVELWLPIAEEERLHPSKEPEDEEPVKSRPLVVLTVDDDPLVLLNAKAMLEDLGHTVITAKSGAEAVEVLDHGAQIDLLITDQAMPNLTGLQLADIVREGWPEVPIIIATGYDEMPAGAQMELEKLSKPYFQNDLSRAIATAIRDKAPAG